jgi:predicted P-loop ATPase
LGVTVTYDAFLDSVRIEGPDGKADRYLDDAALNALWLTVDERCGFLPVKNFFQDVVENEAHKRSFHPVREYLAGLTWDGKLRIDNWLTTYLGAAETPYTRAVGRLCLVAAVRRIRQPGCKFDEMVILESGQGFDKSSALATLAAQAEWFSDDVSLNLKGKEAIEQLAGKWIVEVPELKGMRRGESENHKSFLSRQIDRGRQAYGRRRSEVPRQCVFIGTTNHERYLKDSTGNRRYWPVAVVKFDIQMLRRDRNQLWAEAAAAESGGESIRLDPSLYAAAAAEQELRREGDAWEDVLRDAFMDEDGNDINGRVRAEDVWRIIGVIKENRDGLRNARLGDAMRLLGWERMKNPQRRYRKRCCAYVRGDKRARKLWLLVKFDQSNGGYVVSVEDGNKANENLDQDEFDMDGVPF